VTCVFDANAATIDLFSILSGIFMFVFEFTVLSIVFNRFCSRCHVFLDVK